MKFTKDTLRTILALLLVIIIVVATFAYGNAQRNKQQAKNDAKVTETQTKTNENEKSATVTTPNPPAPMEPNQSVSSAPSSTPATGGEASYVIPLAVMALVGYFYMRSRQHLAFAQTK